MQFKKSFLHLALGLALAACSSTHSLDKDSVFTQVQENYQNYAEISRKYQVNQQWWQGYSDKQLNNLVERALEQNLNLAKATIAVNRAYYNANLVGAELTPKFSGSATNSATKGVGNSNNLYSTGTSAISNQLGFNLSYTLDLWGRLKDAASAAEWEHKASQEDLHATRLSIINSIISSYYNLAYYNDAIRLTEKSLKHYQQISRIMQNKHSAGVIDKLAVEQSMQAVLAAKSTLISLRTAQKSTEQTLRNLLNMQPNEPLALHLPKILAVKLQGVNVDVPVSVIANRPDVIASLQRFQASFKNLTAMEKSWFPTITLGAGLTGSARSVNDVTDNPLGNGVFSFNLPFLDWERVKNNIHLSEEGYKLAKLNYEQTITTALNEVDTYYFAYQQAKSHFSNLQQKFEHDKKISSYYQQRYEQGVAELREWLNAINTEHSSELSLLESKYSILKHENAVYQAMAGKYQP